MVPQKYLNLNIDDLVSDERLKEDTDQPHQPKFEWFELSQTSRRISLTCSACTCPWWSHRWRCSWICRGGWTLWATQPRWSVCSQPGKRVENEKTRSQQPGKEEWIEVTTSILCRDISMLTNTEKYSVMLGEPSWDKTMSKKWLQFKSPWYRPAWEWEVFRWQSWGCSQPSLGTLQGWDLAQRPLEDLVQVPSKVAVARQASACSVISSV